MNLFGALATFSLVFVVYFAPRRWALLGIIASILYIPQAVGVNIGGLYIYAHRFIELTAFIRVLSRGEFRYSQLNSLDRLFLFFFTFKTLTFLIRSDEGKFYVFGALVDAYLCYFALRGLNRNFADFKWFMGAFTILLIPFTILNLIESFTENNLFSLLAASNPAADGWYRDGRLRGHGSFQHASLMGTVGASFIPIFIGIYFANINRKYAVLGIMLCLATVWASNSGGPLNCALFGVLCWFFWVIRTNMRYVRRALVALIVLLGLAMKAPIWFILARVSDISGGDGFHRSELINKAYENLDKWWLAGMPITDTADWFPYVQVATGGADMTNQILSYGIDSGLAAMLLFIAVLVRAYKKIGASLTATRASSKQPIEMEYILWGLGAMLSAHIVNWLGIIYFDQTNMIWLFHLATISAITENHIQADKVAPVPENQSLRWNIRTPS